MKQVTLTLSIPEELKKEMLALKGINWSEETRILLKQRVERMKVLKKLDEKLGESTLTSSDIDEISQKIKNNIKNKHQ